VILDKVHDEAAFRAALRAWLADTLSTPEARAKARASDEDFAAQQWWRGELNKVGLVTPHWPSAFGGADMSLANQVIVAEEMARARAPSLQMFVVSLHHLPATLIRWGTEAQKAKYLPGVAQGVVWCQGFSEPNAGSDLASLRTRAVREGDHFVVNGQKIWSSFSMYADHCILLTRTDPDAPKHAGITYLILDMNTPGVVVRPIKQANGRAEFGELFLTDVRIPVENLVGPENAGWTVAQTTLSAERGVLSFEIVERLYYRLEDYYAAAAARQAPWLDDPELRREFMRLFAETQACRRLLRQLLREVQADSPAQAETVIHVKLLNTTLRKAIGDFMARVQGVEGLAEGAGGEFDAAMAYISAFGDTISGGSNEIMRNLLAERILKMPKG
jgi:alkylation response protein AidB-like acyl-CoA dehydrogenase